MTGFDTPFPVIAIVLAGLAAIGWTLWKRPVVAPNSAWGLAALRAVGAMLITLLLLNPFVSRDYPDASQFAVAVVGDVSRSMETADLPDSQTRLSLLQNELAPDTSGNLWARLAEQYVLEPSTIAADWLAGADWAPRNGDTALGNGLNQLLNSRSPDNAQLGGALLLSDGINLQGERLPDAAIAWRDAGVPVTVVGIGEPTPPGDIALKFTNAPESAALGDPLELQVALNNYFGEARNVEVQLFAEDRLVETQAVQLPAGEESQLTFSHVPEAPGLQVFRAMLKQPATGDFNRANDLDYAAVDITMPKNQSLFYLSARLGPFWRYLQQALGEDDQLQRQCVIQTGPERFFRQGFGEEDAMDESTAGFPESAEEFFPHAVLVVDISAVSAMTPEAREGLREYLLRRGGGVLFMGDPNAMPDDLKPLLPVRDGELGRVLKRTPIELAAQPVFRDADAGVLSMPPGPYLPEETLFFQPADLSLGVRVAAETESPGLPVLTVHAYGAGRVAYLGTESTWRWALTSDREQEQHTAFWQQLIAWLATGGKPRIELPIQGEVVDLGGPVALDIDVRGSDFRPSEDARIRATITAPNGDVLPEVDLLPESADPGRFAGEALLESPGEYRVDYAIEFPDGETLQHTAYFAAHRAGREDEDLRFRETALRDLARITGGEYFSWEQIGEIDELILSDAVPLREERTYWTRNAAFLLAILLVFGIEWFWRRSLGLR
ncbi:hypothetical protein [Cerasicoccus fimbriatus]|uniref:hypothetical protein n=1 Tax=Cerasicoccus fimbriatus TaxID=3014554 RepID=UPI0022B421B2|nr:hypothetical protein [Cerasicoccus sp. TK19100]